MKKTFLLSSVAALIAFSSFSQNYQPATVTTADGKTLEGLVNYKNWKKNPSKIQFRKDETAAVQSFGAGALKSFVVSGDRYVSAVVDIDYRSELPAHITTESNIITHRDTVFLRALITGTKSLYHYYDDNDHYYIAKNDSFELLRYKKYISASSGQGRLYLYNREFVAQLQQYFESCESAGSGVSNIRFETRDLRKAFNSYYQCASGAPEFVQKTESEKSEFGVIAGASRTGFSISSSSTVIGPLDKTEFTPSTNFAAGAFFELVFPRQRGKMSFNNELMYTSYSVSGKYRVSTTATRYEENTFDFAYSHIKLNTMLRYKFLLSKSAIFINGGLSNGFAVSEKRTRTQYQKYDNISERTTVTENYLDSRVHELGFLVGAGFKMHRFSVELRAERSNGPLRENNTAAHLYRVYALAAYRLN